MTGFPLGLVNHTELLTLSLIGGQQGGEEEEKEEKAHHRLHYLCQYVCDLSAFPEPVILLSCLMFFTGGRTATFIRTYFAFSRGPSGHPQS